MNVNRDPEAVMAEWLDDGPAQLPTDTRQAIAVGIRTVPRRRTGISWPFGDGRLRRPDFDIRRLSAALGAVAVIVVVSGLALSFYQQGGIGALPSPTSATPTVATSTPAEPTMPPDSMWPQSTVEEVQAAQELADAGDPRYTWQIDSDLGGQLGQHHPGFEAEIFARFLEEKLGWEAFLWDEAFAHPDGLVDGDIVYIRCAAGVTNPLYPAGPEPAGCAPTIDDLRYETVKINAAQPVRQDPRGIWVVTGWEIIEPAEQVAPPSDAEIAASLGAFLQARIDGEGAEGFADFAENDPLADERFDPEIPLLYATSTGTPYERSEFDLVDGPVWPSGWMQFGVRLFAEDGETVVEQLFSLERDGTGRLRLVYDFQPITENGKGVPVEYGFLDGVVTYRAAYPLEPSQDGYRDWDRLAIVGLLPDDDAQRRVLLMLANPRPIGPGCVEAPAPADAEALAESIMSDPDFEATSPVEVTIGGISALRVDVVLAPGASSCSWSEPEASSASPLLLKHAPFVGVNRARLYLLDLPGGSEARVLAIATITDDDSFETVLEFAAPIIESIEFHAP